jgi:ribosomal protein L29
MKTKEIKTKDHKELSLLLVEKRKELLEFSFGTSGSKAKNVKLASNIKKDVARLLTQINSLRLKK